MTKPSEVLVGLPAFNEGKVISKVISDLKKKGFTNIVVVDDCSKDDTGKKAQKAGATVLKHVINRGAGAATYTIIKHARETKAKFLLLMDSDGQHSTKDALKLLKHTKGIDVVMGSRLLERENMPVHRKVANWVGSLVTFFLFGIYVKDSQSGFKLLNRKAIEKIQLTFDRYEFASEMLGQIAKHKLTYKEVPISVIYTDHSLSQGQSIGNGFRMVLRFIFRI